MIGCGIRSTRRKPAPVPLCPPQTSYAVQTRTRAAALGSQRLTAWATARSMNKLSPPVDFILPSFSSSHSHALCTHFNRFTIAAIWTACFNIKGLCILPIDCIYMFCTIIRMVLLNNWVLFPSNTTIYQLNSFSYYCAQLSYWSYNVATRFGSWSHPQAIYQQSYTIELCILYGSIYISRFSSSPLYAQIVFYYFKKVLIQVFNLIKVLKTINY
jgi:hypothetical protein